MRAADRLQSESLNSVRSLSGNPFVGHRTDPKNLRRQALSLAAGWKGKVYNYGTMVAQLSNAPCIPRSRHNDDAEVRAIEDASRPWSLKEEVVAVEVCGLRCGRERFHVVAAAGSQRRSRLATYTHVGPCHCLLERWSLSLWQLSPVEEL